MIQVETVASQRKSAEAAAESYVAGLAAKADSPEQRQRIASLEHRLAEVRGELARAKERAETAADAVRQALTAGTPREIEDASGSRADANAKVQELEGLIKDLESALTIARQAAAVSAEEAHVAACRARIDETLAEFHAARERLRLLRIRHLQELTEARGKKLQTECRLLALAAKVGEREKDDARRSIQGIERRFVCEARSMTVAMRQIEVFAADEGEALQVAAERAVGDVERVFEIGVR